MRSILRDEIDEAWDILCDLNDEQTGALVRQFMEAQPALGIYLSAVFDSLAEESESPLIEVVMCCWQAMSRASESPLRQVTPEEIDSAEEANTQELARLEEGAEMEWENAAAGLIHNYNQNELLGFGLEMLMSGNEEAPELAPDSVGMELIWLKTVIDCLDQAEAGILEA